MIPGLGRSPGEGNGNPLQPHAWRIPRTKESLAGYSPWGRKESDMTERLTLSLCLFIFFFGWVGTLLLHEGFL